jgi:hypothetical protein
MSTDYLFGHTFWSGFIATFLWIELYRYMYPYKPEESDELPEDD